MDKTSAIHQNSKIAIPIDQDHSHLVKFGADDQDCQAILTFLHRASKKAHNRVPNSGRAVEDSGEDTLDETVEEKMLQSLHLGGLGLRFEEIQAEYSSTLKWIYENKDFGFIQWLEGDESLYWISGKPGSGKSTLMKFIRKDPRTHRPFDQDPPEAKPVFLDFFFHDRGPTVQKSNDGLLHHCLHQLLTEGPKSLSHLILPLFNSLPPDANKGWPSRHIQQAFEVILTQKQVPLRLLFFLDALDEFDGESQLIANFVKDLVRHRPDSLTKVKVCCSSRPWNVFRDAFGEGAGCKVHEHTVKDIQRYIHGGMGENPRMRDMVQKGSRDTQGTVDQLMHVLSDRSQGVFIRVRLVLDELLKACTDGATPPELISYLPSIPDDLDKSYRRLIDKTPVDYRIESYILIETVLRNIHKFGLRDIGLVLLCALGRTLPESASRLPLNPYLDDFLNATRRPRNSSVGQGRRRILFDTTQSSGERMAIHSW